MKICLIAQVEPSQYMGGGKAQYFLTKEWRKLGHRIELLCAEQLVELFKPEFTDSQALSREKAVNLYLERHGSKFDVIDIDHTLLSSLPIDLPNTLVVARSVLFEAHWFQITPPIKLKLRANIKRAFKRCFSPRKTTLKESLASIAQRISSTDLLNVTSELDIEAAKQIGIPSSKVCKFPYALGQATNEKLQKTKAPLSNETPQLVFLGTFDYRKGCLDLVQCFRKLRLQHPNLQLTLIGSKGLHQTEKEVRSFFSAEENRALTVHMTFTPEAISELLAGKHAAIFPSYYEGFPFSVQETLGAGIPTVGYDAPGAHDLLPKEWLVESGDIESMCQKLHTIIADPNEADRTRSKSLIQQYNWKKISDDTLACYQAHLSKKRTPSTNS